MYEHLIINLPRREDPPDAEETPVTNFISPTYTTPNTGSKVQKQEGVVADRPNT
ncbi:hypothetical protein BGZ76_006561 [Entomortierella beljakovae]|nr:hypothetical protein BGZ76_006561 [Entomortierella beljakovae]